MDAEEEVLETDLRSQTGSQAAPQPQLDPSTNVTNSFLWRSPAKTKRINDIDKIDKFIEKELLKLKNPNYNLVDQWKMSPVQEKDLTARLAK